MSVIAANLATFVERGLVTGDSVPGIIARIAPTRSVEEAGEGADLIVETIVENREAKMAPLRRTGPHLPGEGRLHQRHVLSQHLRDRPGAASAPHRDRALVRSAAHHPARGSGARPARPADETVRDGRWISSEQVGHVPTTMEKFVSGFCVNRLLRGIGREVLFLLDNGYMTPEQLDVAVKASIIPRAMVLGFVQRYDFTGLDLAYNNLQNEAFADAPVDNGPRSLVERVERGELGVKTGKGFFDYDERPLEEILHARDTAMLDVFSRYERPHIQADIDREDNDGHFGI